jgi:hypothetical protein
LAANGVSRALPNGCGLFGTKPDFRQDCCEKALQVAASQPLDNLLPDADGDGLCHEAREQR